jgi:hypothetical protein
MEKVVYIAQSFEEAEQHERDYYRSLTPEQRLQILMELNRRQPGFQDSHAPARLPRVYRITQFE